MCCKKNHNFRLRAALTHAAEKAAEDGQVAKERDLRERARLIAADEPADDHRLTVAQADRRVGAAVLEAVGLDVLDVER